jgi:hypothetical protein
VIGQTVLLGLLAFSAPLLLLPIAFSVASSTDNPIRETDFSLGTLQRVIHCAPGALGPPRQPARSSPRRNKT